MQTNVTEKVKHLFRHESGKLVAMLTKTFGISNLELAEDVVQEAMLEALHQWSFKGIPDNPVGWIYNVAKYKAINLINRKKHEIDFDTQIAHHLQSEWTVEPAWSNIFTDQEIADDQLRMMFTCCHPSISPDSQIALTLKTLCGFSIPEIAAAYLTTEENINKRLVRARKTIRDARIRFEIPTGEELERRLSTVLETIYLLFNEGYNATSGDELIRYELCEEAIRLTEIIASNQNMKWNSNVYALLALMLLNASRFKSRTDEIDNIIDLERQDRNKWDKELIKKGLYYLDIATQQSEVSRYHILATISAHHCTAKDFESTDWEGILALYNSLVKIDNSPVVLLNRAIVIYKARSVGEALRELDKIKDKEQLRSYLHYYTTKAELHFQNNEPQLAIELLNNALQLPLKEDIKSFIINKLSEYTPQS